MSNTALIGASGKRTLILEVNDPTAKLMMGMSRAWEFDGKVDVSEWENNKDSLFVKKISFQTEPVDDEVDMSI